jgi:hypothetical protein
VWQGGEPGEVERRGGPVEAEAPSEHVVVREHDPDDAEKPAYMASAAMSVDRSMASETRGFLGLRTCMGASVTLSCLDTPS